jgi:cytochrome c biogenesis protein CcmG/thiol:disulfide interchange protein DsbE
MTASSASGRPQPSGTAARARRRLLAALACGLLAVPAAAAPKAGQAAPDFAVTTLDGRTITRDQLRGKVTLVHFWATWCPPCREEMPVLDKFYRQHRADGFEVIAVSIEDAADEAKVRDFTREFAFPVAMKGASRIDGFGRLWVLPLSFLIDRRQVLRKSDWTGEEKIDAASLDALVRPLLDEK